MTHASGILPDKELIDALAAAKEGRKPRLLKIEIDHDRMVLRSSIEGTSDVQADFGSISGFLEDDAPCYVFFRADCDGRRAPEEWLLLSWVPEGAKVRLKMLYASSRDALKKNFGYSNVACEMHACEREEVSWSEFERTSLVSEADRLSLMSESERSRLTANTHLETGGVKTSYIATVRFPLSEEAKTAVSGIAEKLSSGHGSYVVLKIDTSSETVCLEKEEQGAFSAFFEVLSGEHAKEPRYSIYCGGQGEAAFVFSCPEGAPVRTKMLYSTAKSAVLQAAEGLGVVVHSKLEIRDMEDLTEEECSGSGAARGGAGATGGGGDIAVGGLGDVAGSVAARPKGPGGGRRKIIGVSVLPPG